MVATTAVPTTRWALPDRTRVTHGEVATGILGHGPPIVLTHGTPSWSYLWRAVAPALAEHHTVHLWDLPSYGDSTLEDGVAPSVARHAETLAELVDHWGLDAPALVGHDIGAAVVLRAHLVHGTPADRLVLLDAAVLSPWVTPTAAHMQRHLDVYRSMAGGVFHEIVAAHLATTTHRPLPEVDARAYLDRFAGDEGHRRYLDHVAGFTEDDTRDVVAALGRVTVPTRVVWGEHDRWLPSEHAATLTAAIPGAEQVTIPDAGHFVTEDDPDAVVATLREFLAGNPS